MTTPSRARKLQRTGGLRLEIVALLALLVFAAEAVCQQWSETSTGTKGEAQGSLRVTLTVQSSVGIVMDKDGQPQVIVANAPDVRDGVVYLKEAIPRGALNAPQSENNQGSPSDSTQSPSHKAETTTGPPSR